MAEREESQGFFEMLWDCDHCDTRGLLAKSQRHCANCGAPQNPDKRYFPPEGQAVRVDGHKFEGADRSCPACGAPQSFAAHNCTNCGSPLDGSAEVRGVMSAPQPVAAAPPRKRRRIWPFVLVVLVIIGGVVWWRTRTQEAQVVVSGHTWTRVISIEEFGEHTEEAWRDSIPAGASASMCRDKERSKRQIANGEECHTERRDKKDGTFEQVKKCQTKYRSEPVMDSWCQYRARGWRTVNDLKTSGSGLSPAWPSDASVSSATGVVQNVLGARRQGRRTETLTLQFTGHGSCDVAEPIWRKYSDGQKAKLEVRASSGDVVCGSL